MPVADSENIYKGLIDERGARRVVDDMITALDADVKEVYRKRELSLDTLQGLDKTKAPAYDGPRVYLHVLPSGEGVFALYIGATMDVKKRIK